MTPEGLEPETQTIKRPQTYALDRLNTMIGRLRNTGIDSILTRAKELFCKCYFFLAIHAHTLTLLEQMSITS
jgi:hypothetical protein